MDPRLRTCVDASLAWYADVFALHGIPHRTEAGLWRALGTPPPLHSAAKTVEPGVPGADVLAALAPYDVCSVADSFGGLDLAAAGFSVLIDGTWLFHDPLDPAPLPPGWGRVADEAGLSDWVDLHGTPGVFPPSVLGHPSFTVLARHDDGALTGGAVVHASDGAVTVAHAIGGVEVIDGLALAAALHPGRPVTDYATDVAESLEAGFVAVGPQVVWARG